MAKERKSFENDPRTEKRQFPRLNVSVDVEYKILEKELSPEKVTFTRNIGAGGICLIVYEKIAIGSILALRINLKDANCVIETKGRVVWSEYFTMSADSRDRYDLGIEFMDINESDRQKISQYVFKLIK